MESDIQKLIVDWLRLKKINVAVTDASRAFGKNGAPRRSKVDPNHPDLSAVLTVKAGGIRIGLAFYIEVKTPTGSLSDGQRIKLQDLRQAGAICLIARDLDIVRLIVDRFSGKELLASDLSLVASLLDYDMGDRRKPLVKEGRIKIIDALRTTPETDKRKEIS